MVNQRTCSSSHEAYLDWFVLLLAGGVLVLREAGQRGVFVGDVLEESVQQSDGLAVVRTTLQLLRQSVQNRQGQLEHHLQQDNMMIRISFSRNLTQNVQSD